MNTVSFPGIGIGAFKVPSELFSIGNFTVRWYAICIALGLLIAFFYGERKAKYFDISNDDFLDLVLCGVPAGLIGARIGYVLMDLKSFSSFYDVISVWNGGLSIYGGLITAVIALAIACRVKKVKLSKILDLAVLGFLIGQIVGRFGNFFNIEVYGVETNLPWRMGIGTDGMISSYVHPLFLYEILWNVIGLILILAFLDRRKFHGEVFLWYTGWYGTGRAFMEGLRDSEFQLTAYGVRINQVLAAVLAVGAIALWIYFRFFKTDVHFNADETMKNMSLKELHELHQEEKFEKQSAAYEAQFEGEMQEDVSVTEDELAMKHVMDALAETDTKNKNGEQTDGTDH